MNQISDHFLGNRTLRFGDVSLCSFVDEEVVGELGRTEKCCFDN